MSKKISVMFAGYAPVHFLCFSPIYQILKEIPDVEVTLSGGLRHLGEAGNWNYDLTGLYSPFGIPEEEMVEVDELENRSFDIAFGAQTNLIAADRAKKRIQIFHGISFRNRAVRPENMGCDHYFLAGPYMQRAFANAGLMQPGDPRGLQIGFPKTDALLNGTLNRQTLLEKFGFDGSRPVILYAPTGQKRNSLETMGKAVLKKLTKADEFDIILKTHDHPKKAVDWGSKLNRFEGPHFRITGDLDVIPLLFLADLLITDASSVSSEYSLLDRPMVFLDVPELIERAKAKNGAMVDMDTWGRKGGAIVSDPKKVTKAIRRGLAHPEEFREVRQAMRDDLFFNPGKATEAAEKWIHQVLLEPMRSKS